MKRELESAFVSIAQDCCPNSTRKDLSRPSVARNDLLMLSAEERKDGDIENNPITHRFKGRGQWEALEHYLENYRKLHPRLPVVVAETLLHTDPYIELPLWLVNIFKGGLNATPWGMTGQESDGATLFRLYVNYGRYMEATNLLLEYLELHASLRQGDVIIGRRCRECGFLMWQCSSCGVIWRRCKVQITMWSNAMSRSLAIHLKQIKLDSEDVLSLIPGQKN